MNASSFRFLKWNRVPDSRSYNIDFTQLVIDRWTDQGHENFYFRKSASEITENFGGMKNGGVARLAPKKTPGSEAQEVLGTGWRVW